MTVSNILFDAVSQAYAINGTGPTSALIFSATSGHASLVTTPVLGTATTTLSVPINVNSDLWVTNNSNGVLLVSGPLFGGGNLVLNGTGEVDLRGASTAWTGSLTVSAGFLSTLGGSISSLGDPTTGTVTIKYGASLDASGLTSTASTFGKALVLSGFGNGSSIGPGALTGTGSITLTGAVQLNGPASFYGKSPTALFTIGSGTAGSLSGAGTLIKAGSGTLRLNVPATHTGGTIVNGGTLTLGPAGSLVGTGPVTINNGGRLVLGRPVGDSAVSAAVSPNAIILSGGTLSITADISLANILSAASTSGVLSLDSGNIFTAGGTNLIDFSSLPAGSAVRLGGHVSLPAAMVLIPEAATHTLRFGGGTGTLTLNNAIIDFNAASTNVEASAGPTRLTLLGANTYTGRTILNSGANVVALSSAALGSAAGDTTINPGATLTVNAPTAEPITVYGGTLQVNAAASGPIAVKLGSATVSVGGTAPISLSGGTVILNGTGSHPVSVSGGALTINAYNTSPVAVAAGIVNLNAPSDAPFTIDGGTVTINSSSAGALTLRGGLVKQTVWGSFADGSVIMAGGRLSLVSNLSLAFLSAASTAGMVSIDTTTPYTSGNTKLIDFTNVPGITLTSTSSAVIPADVVIKPDTATNTLRLGGDGLGGSLTVHAPVVDFAGVPTHLYAGRTMLTLASSASTYTGITTVDAGLFINHPAALGAGDGTDATGTIINLPGNITTAPGVTLLNEKITVNGGFITVSTLGPVVISPAGATMSGTYGGPISGAGTLRLAGAVTFSGVNTFTTALTIGSGTSVLVNSLEGLGDSAAGTTVSPNGTLTLAAATPEPITLAGGTLLVTGPSTGPITINSGTATFTGASASPVQIKGGTVALNGPATGPMTLTLGTLTIGATTASSLQISGGLATTTAPTSAPFAITNGTLTIGAPTTSAITADGGRVNINALSSGLLTINLNGLVVPNTGGAFADASVILAGGRLSLTTNMPLATVFAPGSTGGIISLDAPFAFTNGAANALDFSAIPGGSGMSLASTSQATIPAGVALIPDATTRTLRLGAGDLRGTLTLNTALADSAAGPTQLEVGLGQTLLLQTASTYTGATNIHGSVVVSHSLGLGASTGTFFDGTFLYSGTLSTAPGITLAGEKITTLGGTLALSSSGPVKISGPTVLSGSYSGPISGIGPVSFNGTTTLTGDNSGYSGTVQLLPGANITANSGNALGTSAQALDVPTGTTLTLAGASPKSLSVSGGMLHLSAGYTLPLSISAGIANVNATGSNTISISGGTLNLNAVGTRTVNISGGRVQLNDYTPIYNDTFVLTGGRLEAMQSMGRVRIANKVHTSGNSTIESTRYGTNWYGSAMELLGGVEGTGTLTIASSTNLPGPLDFTGDLTLHASSMTLASVNTTGTLQASGNMGILSLNHQGTFTNGGMYGGSNVELRNNPAVINGTLSNKGRLTISNVTTISHFVQSANLVSQGVTELLGTLAGAGTLSIGDPVLTFYGGSLDFTGTLLNIPSIHVDGSLRLVSAPASFTGPIIVDSGYVQIDPNYAGGPLIELASPQASVVVWPDYAGSFGAHPGAIHLNNASGPDGTGGLILYPHAPEGGKATLSGPIDLGATGAVLGTNTNQGTLTLTGPVTGGGMSLKGRLTAAFTNAYTVTGPTTIFNSTLALNAGTHAATTLAGTGTLTLAAPASLTSDGITVKQVSIAGSVSIRPGASAEGTSKIESLTLAGATDAWTGRLDLADQALIVQATSATKAATVATLRNQMLSGRNAGTGGPWTGPGITSSTVAANATAATPAVSLALADNADLHYTSFRGQTLDANAILIVQAQLGDANLDGKVDAFDLNMLAANWQRPTGALWSAGDFTDDGKVDSFDLNLMAANWQSSVGGSLDLAHSEFPISNGAGQAVPEPASLITVAVASVVLLVRRRHTSSRIGR